MLEKNIIRCPACEPISYYGGKTGLPEKESVSMCDSCISDLEPLFAYMLEITGDNGWLSDKTPIFDIRDATAVKAYIAGSSLPYTVIHENYGRCRIEKRCGIALSKGDTML